MTRQSQPSSQHNCFVQDIYFSDPSSSYGCLPPLFQIRRRTKVKLNYKSRHIVIFCLQLRLNYASVYKFIILFSVLHCLHPSLLLSIIFQQLSLSVRKADIRKKNGKYIKFKVSSEITPLVELHTPHHTHCDCMLTVLSTVLSVYCNIILYLINIIFTYYVFAVHYIRYIIYICSEL